MYFLLQYSSHLQHPHRILYFLSDGKTIGQRLVCDTTTTHSTRILREKFRKIVATFFFSKCTLGAFLPHFTDHSSEFYNTLTIYVCPILPSSYRFPVNSYSSQFVLKSVRTLFGQFVLKIVVNSYSFGQFVLTSGQFVLILVDSYSFWSIRTHTQMSTNRPK